MTLAAAEASMDSHPAGSGRPVALREKPVSQEAGSGGALSPRLAMMSERVVVIIQRCREVMEAALRRQ